MASSWFKRLRDARARPDGEDLVLELENGRSHRVRFEETEDTLEFRTIVAKAAAVRDVPDLAIRLWKHNRAAELVSFRIDARGRVCAVGWVPKAGLTVEEARFVLRRVAAESDRLEFLLTGADVE
jgi:hypothetical protein